MVFIEKDFYHAGMPTWLAAGMIKPVCNSWGLFECEQKSLLSKIFRRKDMTQFPDQNELPVFMFKPFIKDKDDL
jgi:hypothetical protein